jgi:hypothetical protein
MKPIGLRAADRADRCPDSGPETVPADDVHYKSVNVAAVDIFRINNDGKIVEHWDVAMEVPESTASGNGLFRQHRRSPLPATRRPHRTCSFDGPSLPLDNPSHRDAA